MISIRVGYGSDLLQLRLHTLVSIILTQDSLGTMVYSDMWNFSHTSTWTQMCIPGSTLVISLALGAVNDIMRHSAVNTPDWWTAETAKRLGVSVGGPRSLARVLPNGNSNKKVEFHSLLRFNKLVLDCWD